MTHKRPRGQKRKCNNWIKSPAHQPVLCGSFNTPGWEPNQGEILQKLSFLESLKCKNYASKNEMKSIALKFYFLADDIQTNPLISQGHGAEN